METTYKYKCKDNDNIIRVILIDGKVDEYHFGNVIDKERIIIGAKDLDIALREARVKDGSVGGSTYWNDFIERYDHRLVDLTLRQILKVYSAWYIDEVHRAEMLIAKMVKNNKGER